MRSVFNALTSRLTPAAVRNSESDSDAGNVHGSVTTEEIFEDHKSDGSAPETGLRFSREFNDESQNSPGRPRHPQTGVSSSGNFATDPRDVFPTGVIDTIGLVIPDMRFKVLKSLGLSKLPALVGENCQRILDLF